MKKKTKMSMIIATAALLCACGSNSVQGPIDVTRTPSPTSAPTPAQEDPEETPTDAPKEAEGIFSEYFASGEVEGSGGNFVRAGRKVYYRRPRPEAFPEFSLFGEYFDEINDRTASTFCVYDLDSRENEELFDVYGGGAMYIGENGIFLGDMNADVTRLIDPGSGQVSDYCDGYPCAVSADGRQLAVRMWKGNQWLCDVWEDGELLYEIGPEADGEEIYGFCGDFLICRVPIDDDRFAVVSYDRSGKKALLGEIPAYEESIMYNFPELIQFLPDKSGCYISVGYYEGTGHFLSKWLVLAVSPGKADSLMVLESSTDCEYPPTMYMEGGDRPAVYQKYDREIELSNGTSGDLIWHDSPLGVTILEKNFIYDDYGDEYPSIYYENIQDAVILDHTAFVISAVGEHMEEADIGWRPAYIPTSYACEVIPFSPELLDANGLPNRNYYLYMDFVEPSVIDVSELTGRWEEFAYIVEGTYGKPQDWEMQYLNFNADGSVTLEKRDVDHADLTAYTLTKTEDDYGGRPCYSVKIYESEEKHTMYRLNDDRLEVSVDWTYSDGTPGGCNIIYHRVTE